MKVTIRCNTCNEEISLDDKKDGYMLEAQRFILAHGEHEVFIPGMEGVFAAWRIFVEDLEKMYQEMKPLYDSLAEALKTIESETGETMESRLAKDLKAREEEQ